MTAETVATVWRDEWGRLLALLVRQFRRLDLAEDSLAEAFVRASGRWPADGVPSNPPAWLLATARRVALDRIKHEGVVARKLPLLAVDIDVPDTDRSVPEAGESTELDDERLRLLFLCCHPALAPASQAALSLRLVLGIETREIARLFLVPDTTMAARITRAKRKIATSAIPFGLPEATQWPARVEGIVRTVYLAFTAAYTPARGEELLRTELAGETIRLGVVLDAVVPRDPAVISLLALMLLQHSRRDARVAEGRLVELAAQDRSAWHHDEITRALGLLADVPESSGYAEELRLQALIASRHAVATTAAATDWPAIADLYARLERITGSPVVRLNRSVAVAEADGPDAGLALLAGLEDALPTGHRLASVRAELQRRTGNLAAAADSYRTAISRCENAVELEHLTRQLAALPLSPGDRSGRSGHPSVGGPPVGPPTLGSG